MTLKIPCDTAENLRLPTDIGPKLTIPSRIEGHQTIAGWVYFRVDEAVLENTTVDNYAAVITDVHGRHVMIERVVMQELLKQDEISPEAGNSAQQ